MLLPENRRLKDAANESILRAGDDPRKLVLFHTAVIFVLSLVVLVIDFIMEQQIGNTGGLNGVGLRSVLETVRTVLQQAQAIALPFWQVGWVYATVRIARGEDAQKKELLEGFRRFLPFLRLTILRGLILMGVIITAAYFGSFIVMLLPQAESVMELMMTDISKMNEAEIIAQLESIAIPMIVITLVLTLALYVPFFYRFRMAEFVLLDNPQMRAREALRGSRGLMRGNLWKLMRLDLSFWWFWLLQIGVSALSLLSVALQAAGILLPWMTQWGSFVPYLLASAAELVLYYFYKARVDVTYAHAYLALLPKEEEAYEAD